MSYQAQLIDAAFVPPAPSPLGAGLPFWEMMRRIRDNPLSAFPAAAFRDPVTRIRFLGRSLHYVSEPAMVEEIMEDSDGFYARSRFRKALLFPLAGPAGDFEEQRLAPLFAPAALARHSAGLGEYLEDEMQRLGRREMVVDFAALSRRLTFTLLLELSGGPDLVARRDVIAAAFLPLVKALDGVCGRDILPLPSWSRPPAEIRRRASVLVGVLEPLATMRAGAAVQRDDFLSHLLTGQPPAEAARNLARILVTVSDITASAVTWTSYLLALFPAVAEEVGTELRWMDLRDPQLTARSRELAVSRAFAESLRLYPPVPVLVFDSLLDHSLAEHEIDKGDKVVVSPWILHRHRKLWHLPDLFHPDRFAAIGSEPTHPFAWLPFGDGPAAYMTGHVAELFTRLVLRALLRRFRLATDDSHAVVPEIRGTLRPRAGLPLRLVPRS